MEQQLFTLQQFYELALKNTRHIEILNREMGCVLEAVKWIKLFIGFQFSLLGATLIGVLRNLYWTKKNGLNNNAKKTLAK